MKYLLVLLIAFVAHGIAQQDFITYLSNSTRRSPIYSFVRPSGGLTFWGVNHNVHAEYALSQFEQHVDDFYPQTAVRFVFITRGEVFASIRYNGEFIRYPDTTEISASRHLLIKTNGEVLSNPDLAPANRKRLEEEWERMRNDGFFARQELLSTLEEDFDYIDAETGVITEAHEVRKQLEETASELNAKAKRGSLSYSNQPYNGCSYTRGTTMSITTCYREGQATYRSQCRFSPYGGSSFRCTRNYP